MTKQTPLHSIHQALGAKLIDFAGYDMPVRYHSDKQEHLAVRERAGIFDVSHMGEFIIRGPKALDFLQAVTSNDVSRLTPGRAQYSCMLNHEGGIIDDLIVYHIRDDQYMVVVNAANIQKDWEWMVKHNSQGAELIDISEKTSLIAVAGPQAEPILQTLTDYELSGLGTYHCYKGTFHGAEKSLVATTGYTGERTFELFVYNEHAERIWHAIMQAGEDHGIIAAGLGARDTLRLEMGYMLYGNDINDSTSPLEAGLGWITKLNKGPFNGAQAVKELKEQGIRRKLVGFKLLDRGIPRAGYAISHEGEVVGKVTSGSLSPVLNQGIGLGYVPTSLATVGNQFDILIRKKAVRAEIVKPPFIQP